MDSSFNVAVHALVYLNHKNDIVSSQDLAQNICTNPARVRKIMAKLKKADLVETKEGHIGGYKFCRNPGEITLYDIALAIGCCFIDSNWKSGDEEMECLVASGMGNIMEEIYVKLDNNCKEYLKGIKIEDIDKKIFG